MKNLELELVVEDCVNLIVDEFCNENDYYHYSSYTLNILSEIDYEDYENMDEEDIKCKIKNLDIYEKVCKDIIQDNKDEE